MHVAADIKVYFASHTHIFENFLGGVKGQVLGRGRLLQQNTVSQNQYSQYMTHSA